MPATLRPWLPVVGMGIALIFAILMVLMAWQLGIIRRELRRIQSQPDTSWWLEQVGKVIRSTYYTASMQFLGRTQQPEPDEPWEPRTAAELVAAHPRRRSDGTPPDGWRRPLGPARNTFRGPAFVNSGGVVTLPTGWQPNTQEVPAQEPAPARDLVTLASGELYDPDTGLTQRADEAADEFLQRVGAEVLERLREDSPMGGTFGSGADADTPAFCSTLREVLGPQVTETPAAGSSVESPAEGPAIPSEARPDGEQPADT